MANDSSDDASPYDAFLVIDKQVDWTSNDVVQKVKGMLRAKKVGHTGTLDPLATGVLVLCLNKATKWASEICNMGKSYEADIFLGQATDTGDSGGKITKNAQVPPLNQELIERAISRFRGEIEQTVPLYSAVKVGGRRLYHLARQGKASDECALPRRQVTIESLELKEWENKRLSISITCSKGTYIRSLAEDIGGALGVPAHLGSLRRLRVGPFSLKEAVTIEKLEYALKQGEFKIEKWLLPRTYYTEGK